METLRPQLLLHALAVLIHSRCDGYDKHLSRTQPERPASSTVLSQNTDESLQATINSTMDHNWTLEAWFGRVLGSWHAGIDVGCVGSHVFELEALRELEVELDGGTLVLTA